MNYIDLNIELSDCLKEWGNLKDIKFPRDNTHDWVLVNTRDWLNEKALSWFKSKNILIKPKSCLFVAPPTFDGTIHSDAPDCAAFNFVIEGHGKMEWISGIVGNKIERQHNGSDYIIYKPDKFDVSETWTGSVGLVNIEIPHRIVSSDNYRYCLSVRTYHKFNELVKMINK